MITLSLIGQGAWGKNYIDAIARIKECRLPQENIKSRDYKNLFKAKNIDGVIIATPASTHFKIAEGFLERGFNLLIEKPLTTSLSDALKLKNSQGRSIVMVGHIFRYNPYFIELEKQIRKIGKIISVHSEGMGNGPFREDVSALWDYAPHDISMIVSILGIPLSISASEIGEKSGDSYILKLKFSGGVVTFSKISRASSVKKRSFIIVGEKGEVTFDDLSDKKLKVRFYLDNHEHYPNVIRTTPLECELIEFVECIKMKRKPKTDLDEAIDIIRLLEVAEKSIEQNGVEINVN